MFAISKNAEERNPIFYPIYNISVHLLGFTLFNPTYKKWSSYCLLTHIFIH